MCAAQYSAAFSFPFPTDASNSQSAAESSPSRSGRYSQTEQIFTETNKRDAREKEGERERGRERELEPKRLFCYCVFKETSVQTTFPKKRFHSCEPDRSDTQIQSRTTQTDTLSLCFCKQWKVEVVTQRKAQINTCPPSLRHKHTHTREFWLTNAAEVAFPPWSVCDESNQLKAPVNGRRQRDQTAQVCVHFFIYPPKKWQGLTHYFLLFKI